MKIEKDQYDLPVYTQLMDQYGKFAADIHSGKIVSAYALDRHGVIAAASKMAFGNKLGVKIEHNLDAGELFAPAFGDIIAEVPADKVGELSIAYTVIGEVLEEQKFVYADTEIALTEAEEAWIALWRVYLRQNLPQIMMKWWKKSSIIHPIFISAVIRSDSRPYLFRYFLEQTVSMTAVSV